MNLFWNGEQSIGTRDWGVAVANELYIAAESDPTTTSSANVTGSAALRVEGGARIEGNVFAGAIVRGQELRAAEFVSLPDTKEIRFGTDEDMTISHSGTNADIINNTGALNIDTAGAFTIKSGLTTDSTEEYVMTYGVVGDGGDNELVLYKDGDWRLKTTTGGVNVNGLLNVAAKDGGAGEIQFYGTATGTLTVNSRRCKQ